MTPLDTFWNQEDKPLKKTAILLLVLCLALAGCGTPEPVQSSEPPTPSDTVSAPPAEESTEPAPSAEQPSESTPPAEESPDPSPAESGQTATLYIGTKAAGFTEYPMAYEGTLTPDALIQGIADLTGWNLTLAEPVVSGKGGMSVCLSAESALFSGPPEPQKDEFHMFSSEQLAETILDSIQKTLQEGFVLAPGDPDTLDIWYFMEGEQPLELPGMGLSWPLDQPYQWADAVRTDQQS